MPNGAPVAEQRRKRQIDVRRVNTCRRGGLDGRSAASEMSNEGRVIDRETWVSSPCASAKPGESLLKRVTGEMYRRLPLDDRQPSR